jgi:uncharacterized membrane protein
MQVHRVFHTGAVTSLVILCIWLLAWEIVVAPLHPGGSLLPLRGVIKRDLYTLQWSSMVILIYFVEGAVRAWSDKGDISRLMALGEVMLVCAYFVFALLYLRPYKKQAQKLAKELLDKVKVPHD